MMKENINNLDITYNDNRVSRKKRIIIILSFVLFFLIMLTFNVSVKGKDHVIGIYSLIMLTYLSVKMILSLFYKPYTNTPPNMNVSVVIPSFNEPGEVLINTLQSILKQTYPDFCLKVVESSTTTVPQGILVRMAANYRDEGKSLEEAYNLSEEAKHRLQHFVMVDDLFHLKKGGRVSGTAATIGTMLRIKVVLTFDREGKLKVIKKVAGGKHKCIKSILDDIEDFTFAHPNCYFVIVHTGNEELATEFANIIEQRYHIKPEIRIMGPTIACHVGPGAVAFAFLSNELRPY